jgi:O-antigen ligase
MTTDSGWIRGAENVLTCVFLAWLLWLPLPYGSIIDAARIPLIAIPLALCALAAILRVVRLAGRDFAPVNTGAWRIWTGGLAVFAAVVALQLIPFPASFLSAVSPESLTIWQGGDRIAALLRDAAPAARAHPVTVDPGTTWRELFRIVALLATFETSALLIRHHRRRVMLAVVLVIGAAFETLYGVRQAALGTYAIWGWQNHLIFNRVTGTYVNPNHFSHYLAIILPMALFFIAWAWHNSAPGAPLLRRAMRMFERRMLPFAFGAIGAVGCLAGMLVGGSRGALLAAFAGCATVAVVAMARSRRLRASRRRRIAMAFGGTFAFLGVLGILVVYLGRERTIARFVPTEAESATLVGRTVGIGTAVGIWRLFPILGSGAGTFAEVGSMVQLEDLGKLYSHAHNDYLEILATTGVLGFVVVLVALFAGWWALARTTFGPRVNASFRRRAFQAAALASVTIAMVHALFDFNFFIPANPATLAAIAGAAVALRLRLLDPNAALEVVAGERIHEADLDSVDTR